RIKKTFSEVCELSFQCRQTAAWSIHFKGAFKRTSVIRQAELDDHVGKDFFCHLCHLTDTLIAYNRLQGVSDRLEHLESLLDLIAVLRESGDEDRNIVSTVVKKRNHDQSFFRFASPLFRTRNK